MPLAVIRVDIRHNALAICLLAAVTLTAGCVASTKSSKRAEPVSAAPAPPEPAPVVRYGRYTLLESTADATQQELNDDAPQRLGCFTLNVELASPELRPALAPAATDAAPEPASRAAPLLRARDQTQLIAVP